MDLLKKTQMLPESESYCGRSRCHCIVLLLRATTSQVFRVSCFSHLPIVDGFDDGDDE